MPRARAAAAATGLPNSTLADQDLLGSFHFTIGREISRLVERGELLEREQLAAGEGPERNYLRTAADHLDERVDALTMALAAFPSSNLAGAAVQLFTAVRIFDRLTLFTEPDPADERALRRLLWSAGNAVADAAGLDGAVDGPAAIAGTTGDPWRDVYEVLDEVLPLTSAHSDRGHVDTSS